MKKKAGYRQQKVIPDKENKKSMLHFKKTDAFKKIIIGVAVVVISYVITNLISAYRLIPFKKEPNVTTTHTKLSSSSSEDNSNHPEFELVGEKTAIGLPSSLTISMVETIVIAPDAGFRKTPKSFCVTDDNLFLFPDEETRKIIILSKEKNMLKLITNLGRNGVGKECFKKPKNCIYDEGKFMTFDYDEGNVYVFDRQSKVDFAPQGDFSCPQQGDDIALTRDGNQMIISGYIAKDRSPYDLYGIDIRTREITYLLPSHEKYELKDTEAYFNDYDRKQTIPSIGFVGYIDIAGDDLYLVWEGKLRIVNLNLETKKKSFFGIVTQNYNKPDGQWLVKAKEMGLKKWAEEKKKFSYIRNIFATPRRVFLIYEKGIKKSGRIPGFMMQIYTRSGDFLDEIPIPGHPGRQMWFDKCKSCLYALSQERNINDGTFTLLKYQIKSNFNI
jgi:hypothetical protein